MAFTKAYAKILAGLLTPPQSELLKALAGKGERRCTCTQKLVQELVDLELVRITRTVEDTPREVALLTTRGKKVAEFV
jgi:hypothetical protein